ncbi:MAG TPA: polymer-forming cytoskeletal protein [Gemmatimonadales bacterium]|nr:polymer-forming cytoskeletal protein [Gemmatimonadales bacterium]
MAIWKEQTAAKIEPTPLSPTPAPSRPVEPAASYDTPRRTTSGDGKESLIASEITIEGKIEGSGHVRIAGRFKGDVHVQGNLTIEAGAKLTGSVRASAVIIGGELDGNIEGASRVELLDTGVLNGDLKAGSLTVAAGSRMRGQVEFGWEEKTSSKSGVAMGISSAS